MKTEEVRNAAHQLDLAVGDLYLKPSKLKGAAGSLRSAWQGGKSNYYANQLQQMGNTMREQVMHLQRLVKRLYAEVDEWEDADGNHAFSNLGVVPAGVIGTGLFTGTFITSSSKGSTVEPFDWYKFGSGQTKDWAGEATEWLGKARIHTEYHDAGEWINNRVGNTHGGYIKKFQNAGRIIKSPAVQWGVPIGLNAVFGYVEGEDPTKALISAGISVGAVKAASHFIPVVGQVMTINTGVQIAGNLIAAGLESSGDHYGAALLQNGMESIDLGGYVDDLSNAVTDMVLPPWNDPPNFSKIGERARKINDLGKFFPHIINKLT
jgi:hypothetical protein